MPKPSYPDHHPFSPHFAQHSKMLEHAARDQKLNRSWATPKASQNITISERVALVPGHSASGRPCVPVPIPGAKSKQRRRTGDILKPSTA